MSGTCHGAQEPVAAAAPEEAQEDGPPSKKQKRDKKDKHKVDVAAAAAPPPATPPPPQQPAGGKGSKPTKAGKQQHPALADEEGFGRLLRVVGKRLKSKGKVGAKKLQALARKKLPALQAAAGGGAEEEEEGELDAQLLQALREKVRGATLGPRVRVYVRARWLRQRNGPPPASRGKDQRGS